MLFRSVGKEDIAKDGVRIMVAHVDSPRLDLKPNPMYEDSGLCYFKTHYYGGIKKYQWTAMPLALHGVVMLRGGERREICVGEDDGDPIFCITDILPHLGAEQSAKPLAKAIDGESLNAVIGALPSVDEEEEKECVKSAILKLLNKKYGFTEFGTLLCSRRQGSRRGFRRCADLVLRTRRQGVRISRNEGYFRLRFSAHGSCRVCR